MKKLIPFVINYLRLYPVPMERVSKVNKVKSMKFGALILTDILPHAPNQKESNVIELTAKQLDNLCTIALLRGTGERTWFDLQRFIGNWSKNNVATCMVRSEEHVKGDKYVDGDGKEQEYTEDSVINSCDSISLPDAVAVQLRAKSVERQVNWEDANKELRDLLSSYSAPVLETK